VTGCDAPSLDELRACRAPLADYKAPDRIVLDAAAHPMLKVDTAGCAPRARYSGARRQAR
jgi:hypothetical protein